MGLGNAVKKWCYLGIFTVKQLIFFRFIIFKNIIFKIYYIASPIKLKNKLL